MTKLRTHPPSPGAHGEPSASLKSSAASRPIASKENEPREAKHIRKFRADKADDAAANLESQAAAFVRLPCLIAPPSAPELREVSRQFVAEHQALSELLRALRVERRHGRNEVRMELRMARGDIVQVRLVEERGQVQLHVAGDQALEERLRERLAIRR